MAKRAETQGLPVVPQLAAVQAQASAGTAGQLVQVQESAWGKEQDSE